MANLAELLSDSSQLFSRLDTGDLQSLFALASHRQVKVRKAVCLKGEPGHEIFIILTGKLKVRSTSGDGREAILGLIEAGEIFGEMAILDGRERSADVIAVQDSHLLVIHRRDFLPFLEARPKACMGIMMALSQRLRKMDALVEDTRFLDLKARLAKTLHQLAQEHGRTVAGGGIRIDFKISQEELGCLVGATRENVNKLIRAWVDEGVLETRQSTVVVCRPECLLNA
jgi:CRP-like cAMP-binding protein